MTRSAHSITVVQVIQADAAALFRAWLDPEALASWWCQQQEGWHFAGAEVDARVGGRYRLGMSGPDGRRHVATGEYRAIAPSRQLVFTWNWEDPDTMAGETLVTVDFRPLTGATEVVVTHEGFAEAARTNRHRQGWEELLRLLDRTAEDNANQPPRTAT